MSVSRREFLPFLISAPLYPAFAVNLALQQQEIFAQLSEKNRYVVGSANRERAIEDVARGVVEIASNYFWSRLIVATRNDINLVRFFGMMNLSRIWTEGLLAEIDFLLPIPGI